MFQGKTSFKKSDRVAVDDESSLHIKDVTGYDSGEYLCKVVPEQNKQFVELRVTGPHVSVQITANGHAVGPELIYNPRSPAPQFRGSSLLLECKGQGGYPKGSVQWTHGDVTNKSEQFYVKEIHHKSGGLYQCLVDNGHGKPQHAAVHLIVERKS